MAVDWLWVVASAAAVTGAASDHNQRALAINDTCVGTSCTETCNTSAPLPCCINTGRCEWDPVFADCEYKFAVGLSLTRPMATQ